MKSNFAVDGRTHAEYRKTKSEMQDWLVAQKIMQENLKEDEQKKSSCMSRKCGRKKKIEPDRHVPHDAPDSGKHGQKGVW